MQHFFLSENSQLFTYCRSVLALIALILIATIGCEHQTNDRMIVKVKPSAFGIVSGSVADQITNQPIPNTNLTFSGQVVVTDQLGRYVLRQVPYGQKHLLFVKSADYRSIKLEFDLAQDYLPLNILLMRTNNVETEIKNYLARLSDLVAGMKDVEQIQSHFSPNYVASKDVVTQFGVGTGVIPADYILVQPTFKKLFKVYDKLLFQFDEIRIQAHHARKASARFQLNIIAEKGPRQNKMVIQTEAKIDLEKLDNLWQAHFLQLLEVHLNL